MVQPGMGQKARQMVASIVVMGHPKRKAQAEALALELDAEIVWDRGQGLCDTAWRAWQAQDGEWRTVIQDDAIPAANFRANLDRILTGTQPVSWYYGTGTPNHSHQIRQKAVIQAKQTQASWIEHKGPWWAVGVSIHESHIDGLLAQESKMKADDARYTAYFTKLRIPCRYTWPSLLDHTDGESIAGPGQRGSRRAVSFLPDADTFNPDGPVVVFHHES